MQLPESLLAISKANQPWRNATGNVETTAVRFFFPRHKEDISAVVQVAEREGLRVRAVGAGHSYSEAAKGRDFLMSMENLTGLVRTDPAHLTEEARSKNLVSVKAGTTIHDLNRDLDKLDLALPNMGAVDYQTVSGALMTGTHGSGIRKPAFPDMVRSLKLVSSGGKYVQVEPANGITDPSSPLQEGVVELIQDDDVFFSTVLSFGGMGIVYELVFEVDNAFWMEEKRYLKPCKQLRAEILDGSFMELVEANDFAGFRVNPYLIDGDHLCAVVEQKIIDKKDRPKGLNALFKNVISSLGGRLRFLIDQTIRALNKNPAKAPGRIQTALKTTKDKRFAGKSFKVLFQSGPAISTKGISAEFAFEAKPEILVGAIETAFQLVNDLAKQHNLYQSSFLSVRFVQESKALLSPNFGRPTFYLDVPLLKGTKGDMEILSSYQLRMKSLGGIPHWGKINERLYEDNAFLVKTYGDRLETWRRVQLQMDPKGVFLNDFIQKMGLAPLPAQA